MATHEAFNIKKFWDDEFKNLNYTKEKFNDSMTQIVWEDAGFRGPFGGYMCDMRNSQPSWNAKFIDFFERYEHWKNIGTSYYRMDAGSSLPNHVDTYKRYIELFGLQGQEHTIRRALLLLEDWRPGHYLEVNGRPYVNWMAGKTVEWYYDVPHSAANIGLEPRYSLQITGHV